MILWNQHFKYSCYAIMSRSVSLGMDLGKVGSRVSGLYMGFACTLRWVPFGLAHHLTFWALAINLTFMATFQIPFPLMDGIHLGWTWVKWASHVLEQTTRCPRWKWYHINVQQSFLHLDYKSLWILNNSRMAGNITDFIIGSWNAMFYNPILHTNMETSSTLIQTPVPWMS